MNPRNIIGWLAVGVIGLVILLQVPWAIARALIARALYRRTRNDLPHEGDVWVRHDSLLSRGYTLHIKEVTSSYVVITSELPGGSRSQWSMGLDEWHARVRRQKLWRSKP